MKYLKKFNEELKPSTYRSAARKLTKNYGHKDRADSLNQWANKREVDVNLEKWRENIEQMSKFGKFKLNIVKNRNSLIEANNRMTGEFYLDISFDGDSFMDSVDEFKEEGAGSLPFFIGIIPVDKDILDKCESVMPEPDMDNGFYWGMYLSLSFTLQNDTLTFTKYELGDYDPGVSGYITIADRSSAGRFKSLLKGIFTDENLNYPSGRTDVSYMYEVIQNIVCIEAGLSSEYGFSVEQAGDFISKLSPNEMYKSI